MKYTREQIEREAHGKLGRASAMLRQLLAENDALRDDAQRYQMRIETIRALYPSAPSDCELDAAIDAARKKG